MKMTENIDNINQEMLRIIVIDNDKDQSESLYFKCHCNGEDNDCTFCNNGIVQLNKSKFSSNVITKDLYNAFIELGIKIKTGKIFPNFVVSLMKKYVKKELLIETEDIKEMLRLAQNTKLWKKYLFMEKISSIFTEAEKREEYVIIY
jgi:hypothetical protein